MSIADVRALSFGDVFDAHVVLDAVEAELERQRLESERERAERGR